MENLTKRIKQKSWKEKLPLVKQKHSGRPLQQIRTAENRISELKEKKEKKQNSERNTPRTQQLHQKTKPECHGH
jgi:hypothetical protein